MPVDPTPGLTSWQIKAWQEANVEPPNIRPTSAADRAEAARYPVDGAGYKRWVNEGSPTYKTTTQHSAPGATKQPAKSGGNGGDLMSLIHEAGFKGQAANIMYGIVMAESGGNATAHNYNTGTGDDSYGLAQINMLGSMGPERLREYGLNSYSDLYDPLTNLRVAYKMSGGGSHWGDWSTYNSGAYLQYMGQSGATVTNKGGGGGGGMDSASGSGTPPTMADYQGVDSLGRLLDSVPELRQLVDQAMAHDWSTDKFQNAIENSKWWRTHSDTARQIITQQANDPASYNQALSHVKNSVSGLAHQLGMPLTAAQLEAISTSAMLSGNDNNQQWLTQQIGKREDYSHLTSTGGLQGGMANTVQQLQSLAGDYGYTWTPSQLGRYAQQILMGNQTIDTYKQSLIRWAKSTFPGLQQELDSGQTVKDLADPYIQSMSNLLEVDPNTLTVYDPKIRRALQGAVDPSTKVRAATPLWQFEDQLRADPRWAYTQNAKDTMSTALVKVGHDFGFGF